MPGCWRSWPGRLTRSRSPMVLPRRVIALCLIPAVTPGRRWTTRTHTYSAGGRWRGRRDEENHYEAGVLKKNPTETGPAEQQRGGATSLRIVIPEPHSMVSLLGSRDELLTVIEDEFDSDIHVRGNEITVTGPASEAAVIGELFEELTTLIASGTEVTTEVVERSVAMLRRKSGARPADVLTLDILSTRGRTLRPKTLNQKRYVDAIDKHTIVFSIGPAGTGKTYLAMAKAVKALQAKEVNRIILTRPAVEAGERLGFLPGTLYEKIDPYLRPLYDALHDMVDPGTIPKLTTAGTIGITPLALFKGRSLNDFFIILHQGPDTTADQMKMFLTRLGFGPKIVVTRAVDHADLPPGQVRGV